VRFKLGRLLATPGAIESVGWPKLVELLRRHARGDWRHLDRHDRIVNLLAVRAERRRAEVQIRVFSAYNVGAVRLWVITEADRSSTIVLLPSEY